jgi:hypothetical protein
LRGSTSESPATSWRWLAASGPEEAGREVALGLGEGLARSGRRLSELTELSPPTAAWLDRLLAEAAQLASENSFA